jgi:hypothetical protein
MDVSSTTAANSPIKIKHQQSSIVTTTATEEQANSPKPGAAKKFKRSSLKQMANGTNVNITNQI